MTPHQITCAPSCRHVSTVEAIYGHGDDLIHLQMQRPLPTLSQAWSGLLQEDSWWRMTADEGCSAAAHAARADTCGDVRDAAPGPVRPNIRRWSSGAMRSCFVCDVC